MPYLNKRNRFISAAKQYAENANKGVYDLTNLIVPVTV
jgi:hypothetical protein